MSMKYAIPMLLIALFCASPVFSDEPDKTLHNKCLYPTVLLKCADHSGLGTGTVIRSEKTNDGYANLVLTCSHVLNCNRIEVLIGKYKDWSYLEGYSSYQGRVFASSPDDDLGLLLFHSDKEMPTAEIDFDSKLYIGSKVLRFGCAVGDQMRLDYGSITSINHKIGNSNLDTYRMNIFTVPGDSGAAVFLDHKIVAITQAIRSAPLTGKQTPLFNISYSIPVSRIKSWNSSVNNRLEFAFTKEPLPILWSYQIKFDEWTPSRSLVDVAWETK